MVHCPSNADKIASEDKKHDLSTSKIMTRSIGTSTKAFIQPLKQDKDEVKYCHRFKNSLSDSSLKPQIKKKFPSQRNLNGTNKSMAVKTSANKSKKTLHSSYENIKDNNQESSKCLLKEDKETFQRKEAQTKNHKVNTFEKHHISPNTDLNMQCSTPINIKGITPLSKTTRKLLFEKKQRPFFTFGCNNNSFDIGTKKTHNVLASKPEVNPNALLANMKRRDFISKYMQSEMEFQKRCIPNHLNKVSSDIKYFFKNIFFI